MSQLNNYLVDVVRYLDYYPFRMLLPGRHGSASEAYRYGFNGMEGDDELKGEGNSYTTEFRQYDPRVGRWLSIDPKFTAWDSPYVGMANNPIMYNDIGGDSAIATSREMADKIVDDMNVIYEKKYGVKDAFSVKEVKFFERKMSWYSDSESEPSETLTTGYAIVTNDIASDPGFWNDWTARDKRGYRGAIYSLLNSPVAITVTESFQNGSHGSAYTMGMIFMDDNLSSHSLDGGNNQLSTGGVFLHEAIYHKSIFGLVKHEEKKLENAHAMQEYYGLSKSKQEYVGAPHNIANAVESETRQAWNDRRPGRAHPTPLKRKQFK